MQRQTVKIDLFFHQCKFFQVTRGLFHARIIANLHGGSLASSIMPKEGGDLPLVEVQVEVLHCHFPIRIDLVEVIDGHSCNEADEMMKVQVRENFTITEKLRYGEGHF